MTDYADLLTNNRAWADAQKRLDPDYFEKLSSQQSPEFLWIGCSDSRVSANVITGLMPGEVFVHRNIANLVVHTDLNCLSVLQFAVEVLKVKHIIVCGHYGCGGIQAAMDHADHGLIDQWLQHIRDVYRTRQADIDAIGDQTTRLNRLCELNIVAQISNLCATNVVKRAWQRGQSLEVHGFVYSISDGILQELINPISSPDQLVNWQLGG